MAPLAAGVSSRSQPFPDFFLFVTVVELDVASAWMGATQIAAGEVAVGQLDFEDVVAARLAFVAGPDSRGAGLAVDGHSVVDNPAIWVIGIRRVSGDGCGLDVHAVAVVD